MRNNGRKNDEMREVKVTKNYIIHPEGSVLIEFGNTKDLMPGLFGNGMIKAE